MLGNKSSRPWIRPQTRHRILEQFGAVSVRLNRAGSYDVYVDGSTYATRDSAYPLTADGYSIAVARAKYLDKRATAAEVRK